MLTHTRNHQVVTSRRTRLTSLLVTPAYVMLGMLFVWMVHLQAEFRNQQYADNDKVYIGQGQRVKRSADSSSNSFFNMLPGLGQSNVLYDMELEPCGGAVFTVWGRSVCPEETKAELVYEGIVGGTNTDSHGGGVDYLCLSRHPQWTKTFGSSQDSGGATYNDETHETDTGTTKIVRRRRTNSQKMNFVVDSEEKQDPDKPCTSTTSPSPSSLAASSSSTSTGAPRTDAPPSEDDSTLISRDELLHLLMGQSAAGDTSTAAPGETGAYLYGAEYQGAEVKLRKDNLAADTFVDQDAVCAVCRSRLRLSAVMIPGRRECYSGWTKEYEGFLMSGPVGAPSQHRFVCVHSAPEAAQGGFRGEGGAVFYHVKAMCGSLPCPTYIQDKEVTCVVCTK